MEKFIKQLFFTKEMGIKTTLMAAIAFTAGLYALSEYRQPSRHEAKITSLPASAEPQAAPPSSPHTPSFTSQPLEDRLAVPTETLKISPLYITSHSGKNTPSQAPLTQEGTEATLNQEGIEYSRNNRTCLIIAYKRERQLQLYCRGILKHSFAMDLGQNPHAEKKMQGDGTTPEGRYQVKAIKDIGQSRFYRAFLIDYPTSRDITRFETLKKQGKIPQGASIGGDIEIHGNGGTGYDWTLGCMGIEDGAMDRLFHFVKKGDIRVGTPIIILRE